MDDLSSEEERLLTAGTGADRLDELVLDQRDRLLLDTLQELHRCPLDGPLEVAVVYGAGHMSPVVRGLLRLGYRPVDDEWLSCLHLPRRARLSTARGRRTATPSVLRAGVVPDPQGPGRRAHRLRRSGLVVNSR